MGNDAGIDAPAIEDLDIPWVCELLGLPATAFSGADGTDPRLPVLRSMDTLDIEACPGSGKTTLLVAKLAILARKWTQSRRGLCVLSHTNVARREIETSLGNTAAGQRLLSYPHFIGTIHGFVTAGSFCINRRISQPSRHSPQGGAGLASRILSRLFQLSGDLALCLDAARAGGVMPLPSAGLRPRI